MKFLITLCLTVLMATVVCSRSATWGGFHRDDYVVYRTNVECRPQYSRCLNKNVHYPKRNRGKKGKNISAIFVFDRLPNGTGAEPSLLSGGPGYNFATIKLSSPHGSGINSTVEIYGK